MRSVLLFLLAALVAYGIWVISGGAEEPVTPLAPDEIVDDGAAPTPEELRMRERLGRKTGTLSIRARTTDDEVAAGLEVGYVRTDGTVRWQYAVDGSKVFTDAPLGLIEAAARATGYAEVRQKVQVIADVPCEAVILLRPTARDEDQR